jgi:hypothetical protein
MKFFTCIFSLCAVLHFQTFGSSTILMSTKVPATALQSIKNLNDTVVPYPMRGVFADGTVQQGLTNRTNKVMPALKTRNILSSANFSVLPLKKGSFQNYPSSAALFAGYADIASDFESLLALFKAHPDYVTFLRKVHVNALSQLYHYLMSIYVNFNLQHTGISQSDNGDIHVDIPAFLKDEDEYAANKKTLIINHLINIIESQFNSTIRSYVPKLPQMYASYLGKTLTQNDYGIDLSEFLKQQTEPSMQAYKKNYLQGLALYLKFFQTYTGYLLKSPAKTAKSSPTQSGMQQQLTAFVGIAQNINQLLYDQGIKLQPCMFEFTYDDIRALKIIPYLAKSLPKNTKRIMWPEQIVQAANEGILLNEPEQSPHPIAYFRTAKGIVVKNTDNSSDSDLYICMRTGQNLFEEKLIPEPEWLASWSGVAKIMRACFGDISELVGLDILDPCLEMIIKLATVAQQGQDPNVVPVSAQACLAMFDQFKAFAAPRTSSAVAQVLPGVTLPLPTAGVSTSPLLQQIGA